MKNHIHRTVPCIVSFQNDSSRKFLSLDRYLYPVTMLSGARNHRDTVLSRKLFDRMQSLFPDHKDQLIAASILLANTYRSVGDHMEAEQIRNDRIKHLGNKIKPGCSWTEVNGELVVNDNLKKAV